MCGRAPRPLVLPLPIHHCVVFSRYANTSRLAKWWWVAGCAILLVGISEHCVVTVPGNNTSSNSVLAFSGVTPSMIADWAAHQAMYAGGQVLHVVTQVSKSWLGDPWLWVGVVGIVLALWWWRQPATYRQDPESDGSHRRPLKSKEDNPESDATVLQLRKKTNQSPARTCTPDAISATPVCRNDCSASFNAVQHVDTTITAPKSGLARRQAYLIQHMGQTIEQLRATPCQDVADFMPHVAKGASRNVYR